MPRLHDPRYRRDHLRLQVRGLLAGTVKSLRLDRGLIQKQLAVRAGVPQSQIARLESLDDERVPSLDFLAKLFAALGQRAVLRIGPPGGRKSTLREIALV
ncbi:MAG: helix-turn-helix transcriptional regulator [Elusimicrobia bacterium]|nr:helix-turn-helix transcriptional regulator [Elusimicrobiota bacterium]